MVGRGGLYLKIHLGVDGPTTSREKVGLHLEKFRKHVLCPGKTVYPTYDFFAISYIPEHDTQNQCLTQLLSPVSMISNLLYSTYRKFICP